MPDRVLAFENLPERFLSGFEMCKAEGFPRHWKEWLGKMKRNINIPPEKDFLTGQIRRFPPIVEEDSFFYLVDYTSNPSVEKWKEVCDYVRQHVSKEVRLMEKLDDMALPLAANKSDGVTLEPEDVPMIHLEKEPDSIIGINGTAPVQTSGKKEQVVNCPEVGCKAEYKGQWAKNALRMHTMKIHKKQEAKQEAVA